MLPSHRTKERRNICTRDASLNEHVVAQHLSEPCSLPRKTELAYLDEGAPPRILPFPRPRDENSGLHLQECNFAAWSNDLRIVII
ncbi:hypothetical protein K458DRAFT_176448 [Lentithecium fluviatile CBS 122367]|uniref:Uncharacterized protein n=1 Tax=Lentithecium fluviatile CBS 122367 TaxID=1168545 RepID=A0A6G1JD98_9PLEO|nr:hypothetical protein K458DRAFT_176448 [Lentithecium fluviatile CBS 122367]